MVYRLIGCLVYFFICPLKETILFPSKVHIAEASDVADHCITYALSDPKEASFCGVCNDHEHSNACSSCKGLRSILSGIEAALNSKPSNLSDEDHDDMMYSCQQAIQAIEAWKAHQLRSHQQDKCRINILRELSCEEVFITQDWAMKFLPVKYRETQADWFGKRGISWHISVVVRKATDGHLEHQAFVHVAQNCSQDSSVVVSIIEHILRTLKVEHPEITTAFFRQDNAGCYHNSKVLAACRLMQEATGVRVERVDFSDPQGAKGPCDRKAVTIKAHVRRFVDEGHDVLTATDLRDAILSNNGVRGARVTVVNAEDVKQSQASKWEGVSNLNNFMYKDDGVVVWRAYNIGEGKTMLWSQLKGRVTATLRQRTP